MGNNLDAPARSSDALVQEAPPSQERALVSYPTNAKEGADFNGKVASMRSGNDSMDLMLKGFALTGTDSTTSSTASTDSDGDGIPDDPNGPTSSELKRQESSLDSDGDGIPDKTERQDSENAVLEQLTKLQSQTLSELSHAGEDSTEDTGATAVLPNNLSLEYHGAAKLVSDKRKQFAEAESSEFDLSANVSNDDLGSLNTQQMAARAFAGDAVTVANLPQGIDKISIFDITTRREDDGSVVLVAPRGHGSDLDKVPLVDNEGSNIKASRLGQFLQSDGTMFMREDGRAYRPGDNFVAAIRNDNSGNNGNFAVESDTVEKSLVIDKTELTNLSTNLASEKLVASQRFAALRESKLEAPARESVASISNDSTTSNAAELSFDPKEAAEQQRSIKVRLGETLRSVAVRDLNDVKNWQVLAEKNNLSTATDDRGTPLASLQRGMVLTLPTASEIENFQARASLAAALQLT